LETGFQTVPTSSMGRLCDAVASLAGVCQVAGYEAQAAIELEALAPPGLTAPTAVGPAAHPAPEPAAGHEAQPAAPPAAPPAARLAAPPTPEPAAPPAAGSPAPAAAPEARGYTFAYNSLPGGVTLFDPSPLLRQAAADVLAGQSAAYISAHFHAAVAAAIVHLSRAVRAETGIARVALTGGVFQNVVLLHAAVGALRGEGFTVLVHRRVPPNDGGLALGQVMVAARRLGLW
jgi:hydrogenase maturation protein HypF